MIQQTRGIVLQRYKYTDSKVIAKIYTQKFGLISCIFLGTNSIRGRSQMNVLQPLYITDISIYYKERVNLQKVKDAGLSFPLYSLSMNIVKNTISLFLAEFILKTIKENEPDEDLFEFLTHSIIQLNETEEGIPNFHLKFLFKLTQYMGIMPINNYSESQAIFDLKAGQFRFGRPDHKHFLNLHLSLLFSKFYELEFDKDERMNISNKERKEVLKALIDYYNIHLERPGIIKSINVLQDVFS